MSVAVCVHEISPATCALCKPDAPTHQHPAGDPGTIIYRCPNDAIADMEAHGWEHEPPLPASYVITERPILMQHPSDRRRMKLRCDGSRRYYWELDR